MKVLNENEYSKLVDEIILAEYGGRASGLIYHKLISSKYQFYKYPYRISYAYYITFESISSQPGYTDYYHFWLKVDPTKHSNKIQFYILHEWKDYEIKYSVIDLKFINRQGRYVSKESLQIIKKHLSKKKFQRIC